MSRRPLILATDLDGTFLGGTDEQRSALYADLRDRDDLTLIFITGRDVDFIRELLRSPEMPRPRYVVGDIGTSIYDGRTLEPVAELEAPIVAKWNDANDRVLKLLEDEPGLKLQQTPFRHRVSYDYEPKDLRPESIAKVQAAGFDCLLSASCFFDVLPKGISKGPTLVRLVEELQLDAESVLVAGDTLNDLSLFQTGYQGVAVANSEPKLSAAVRDMPNVYRSQFDGAAGIADAIRFFQFEGGRSHEKIITSHRISPSAE